jgi:hypothetical protein
MNEHDWLWLAFGMLAYLVYDMARRVLELEGELDELRNTLTPEDKILADLRAGAGLPARPLHIEGDTR